MSAGLRHRSLHALLAALLLLALPMSEAVAQHTSGAAPAASPLIGGSDSIPPAVYVTPAAGGLDSQTVHVSIVWCDNTSIRTNTYYVEHNSVAVTSSFTAPTSGGSPHCTATYTSTGTITIGQAGRTADTLRATIFDNAFNQGSTTVVYNYLPADTFKVAVAPKGGDTLTVATAHLDTTRFEIHNAGNIQATYALTRTCTGAVFATGCTVLPSLPVTLGPGDSVAALVTYTADTNATTGRVTLVASQTSPAGVTAVDTGWVNVVAATPPPSCATMHVSVVPCTVALHVAAKQRNLQQDFWVTNLIHLEPVSYGIGVTATGAVIQDSVAGSLVVKPDSTARVTVFYSVSDTSGTGTFTLTVDDGMQAVYPTATVTVTAPPPPPPFQHVSEAPHYATLQVDPGTAATQRFTLTNQSTDSATIEYASTCSGTAIASGCTPATDTVRLAPQASATASIAFTASTTGGATGSVGLRSWVKGNATVVDSGVVDVTVVRGSGVVDVATVNPGSTVERGLCLHVSVARGMSYSCGDLQFAYALPSTTTLTSTHTPVLLYNSGFAAPRVVIAANVTLPADGRIPDSVSALLLDSVGVKLDSAKWAGSNWTAGSTRRIALRFDPVSTRNYPTGVHRYALQVTRVYGGVASRDTVSGAFVVVRQDHSQFGKGWYLAGLERLYKTPGLGTLFWVGGDGSTRTYVQSPTNPTAWGAVSLDRPDTVRRVGARFVRDLPHGVKVQFDTVSGCHMETVNRLGQTTAFAYTDAGCGRLHTITLAPAAANKVYTFSYINIGGNWRLARIDAPPIGTEARYDSIFYNANGQVSRLSDVYGDTIGLRYRATYDPRLTTLIDERGDTLTFAYQTTTPSPFIQATIPLATDSNAVTTFTPIETRGLQGSAAVSLERAYALIDGPRTDVGDTTLVWSDRFGDPTQTRNALGDETVVTRGDTRWPVAVTRVRWPNGQILAATYDSLGHLASETDSSRMRPSPLTYATTTYQWDPAWDFVTKTVNPEGDFSSSAFDATTGNALWEKDGAGHQTTFYYYTTGTAAGLLRSAHAPMDERDSLVYDAQTGNLTSTISPLGTVTSYARDDAGRVVADTVPSDSTVGDHITVHLMDLLDRDTLTVDSAGTQALSVRQHYDPAGNLDTLWKWSSPDPNHIGVEKQGFVYDRAGRKISETLVGYQPIQWTYDAAGNVLYGGRRPTYNVYDALNRRVLAHATESATFGYDAVGHLLFANNPYARISRSYAVDGDLIADTLRIGIADSTVGDFTQHVYGIGHRYDLDGRVSALLYPGSLATAQTDTVHYAYDGAIGVLDTLVDRFGTQFRYRNDDDGRLSRLTRVGLTGDSIWDTYAYDADSRLVRRVQRSVTTIVHNDSLMYNRRGRVVRNPLVGDTLAYSAFGALRYAAYATSPGAETIVDDALGNHSQMWIPATTYALHTYAYSSGSDRLSLALLPSTPTDTTFYYPDVYGSMGEQLDVHDFPDGDHSLVYDRQERDLVNAYNGQQQLIRTRIRVDTAEAGTGRLLTLPFTRVEFYRYDALGRRVWQRFSIDTGTVCDHDAPSTGCANLVTRTVWDGDQVLYEIRAPGDTTGPLAAHQEDDGYGGVYYGAVGYVHGPGIDQPLEVFKGSSGATWLYTNWRGDFDCCSQDHSIDFPAANASSYGDIPPTTPSDWWGTLITQQQDLSGYQYKRNRYYDPTTGRFTQEDPMGLAGGLNAYRYADDDPVSYRDPFGLSSELGSDVGSSGADCLKVHCPSPRAVVTNSTVLKRAQEMYKQTLKDGKERGAWVFNGPNGTIVVGPTMVGTQIDPKTHTAEMPQMVNAPDSAIAELHTHPPISGVDGPSGPDSVNASANHIMAVVRDRGGLFILTINGAAAYRLPLPKQ